MGVHFEFSLVSTDSIKAKEGLRFAFKESKRIEKIISSWDNESETSKINKNAGIKPVKVSPILFKLIERSKKVSKLTQGNFDISFASITPHWTFNGQEIKKPDSLIIKQSVAKINYQNIILNKKENSVFLKEKGMKIGFGAIGKGFVAEHIMTEWKKMGFTSGLINASGDIRCFGKHPKTESWKIGIANPKKPENYVAWFNLNNSAVVTSGNYKKFVTISGERYGHIINPKTGWPSKGIISVTIFCNNAELADALATSVFVMGTYSGLNFINQLNGIEALIIDEENKLHFSKNLKSKYQ